MAQWRIWGNEILNLFFVFFQSDLGTLSSLSPILCETTIWISCSVSCAVFECFSSFLEWTLCHRISLKAVVYYRDSFFFVGPKGTEQCKSLFCAFMELFQEFGVSLAHKRTEGPTQVLTFFGLELDTQAQTLHLSVAKLVDLCNWVVELMDWKKVSLHRLQELVGSPHLWQRRGPGNPWPWVGCKSLPLPFICYNLKVK